MIRVWDAKTGQVIARAKGHTGGVPGFFFSADDAWFASSSEDGTVMCWETRTGDMLRRFTEPKLNGENMLDVTVSSDGKWVAAGGNGTGTVIRLWDVHNNRLHKTFQGHKIIFKENLMRSVESLRFLPDNRHLISCGTDSTMRIWDIDSGEEVHRFTTDSYVWRFALSDDGRRAVTGHHDGTVRVWLLPAFSKR